MLKKIKGFFHRRSGESGRSMVEMLGVLAVIGVLTVGGLAGYNYAITKHRVNTILNELSLRFTVAEQQMTVGAPINMSEFDDTVLGKYKIDVYQSPSRGNVVEFRLSNIPYEVAKQLFSSGSNLWNLPLSYFDIQKQTGVIASNDFSYPKPIQEVKADGGVTILIIVIGIIVGGTAGCSASPEEIRKERERAANRTISGECIFGP
ncbi:MAG: hypothetical protein IKS41_06435 [Alphaproteobacteria bacterium]|nr:hypothetical protein [Alphaproteobacteria bacterium]